MSDSGYPEGWTSLGQAWRSENQPLEAFQDLDVTKIRARSEKFSRRIQRRNLLELLGGAIVIVLGLNMVWTEIRPLGRLGGGALALGALVVMITLLRRGRNATPPPPDASTREVLSYEQGELERQARLLESVWTWYLAPLLPGALLKWADELVVARGNHDTQGVMVAVVSCVAGLICFFLVARYNVRAARKLRERARAILGSDEDVPSA